MKAPNSSNAPQLPQEGRSAYLPALVMIISVPMSWKRFHRSAHCSSTWISSMEKAGEASQGPGASSAGEPKEHDVLSARPSPSEPGLASESAGRRSRPVTSGSETAEFAQFTQETWRSCVQRIFPLTPHHLQLREAVKLGSSWISGLMSKTE